MVRTSFSDDSRYSPPPGTSKTQSSTRMLVSGISTMWTVNVGSAVCGGAVCCAFACA
jgi:hypothetical protein